MELLQQGISLFGKSLPFLTALLVTGLILMMAHWLLLRRQNTLGSEGRMPRQLSMLLLTAIGFVFIILALPVEESTRGQLLGLLGLLLSAMIALSSTTLVANAMAGLMLRTVKSFRPGDFIRIDEQFGRVSERGLFHTEIQTEDRDLTTLPNLYLISHPVTVVHSSGTIVSTTLSLGYDISHTRIEPLLIDAAHLAELQEPFVQVVELGDFSINYRVAGFLPEVKQLLTARSTLRKAVLDTLHANNVEIVSPSFMNQRRMPDNSAVIPGDAKVHPQKSSSSSQTLPETLIFDKADQAEELELTKEQHQRLQQEIKVLENELADADETHKGQLEKQIILLHAQCEKIETILEHMNALKTT